MHLLIHWLPSIIIRQRLSSSALLEQTGWVIGKTREKRPSSLDRSSPNKMPLSDLLLLPSYSPPESNNLQRVWAYIIKGAISPISSEIPRFGEKKLHSKGQLISKANFKVFIWTKKPTKIFLYFCASFKKPLKSGGNKIYV